jgi:hypothetical protein
MSTDNKTKAELVPIFKKLVEEESDASGKAAMILLFEVLCDIRDGLIRDEVTVSDHFPTKEEKEAMFNRK